MRRRFVCSVSAATYLFICSCALAEQYLCVPDKATGFAYDINSKDWGYTRFKTDKKYLIAPSKEKEYVYAFTEVGDKSPIAYCEKDFNSGGYLFCNQLEIDVKFNKVDMRFQMISSGGYVGGGLGGLSEAKAGGLWVQIGKCSPF